MSNKYLISESDKEREIENLAVYVLQECFIEEEQSGPVLYVENDILIWKSPNEQPVLIKHLSGRNSDLAQRILKRRVIKIKKCKIDCDWIRLRFPIFS